MEESGLPESQALPLCTLLRERHARLAEVSLGGHQWSRDCLVECARSLIARGSGGSEMRLKSLVLPTYGLKDIIFRFKDRFNPVVSKVGFSGRYQCCYQLLFSFQLQPQMKLSRLLEPVATASTDAEMLFNAVVERLREVVGYTWTVVAETKLDGIKFNFSQNI